MADEQGEDPSHSTANPTNISTASTAGTVEAVVTCSICLSSIQPTHKAVLPCLHEFCDTCILSWVKSKLTCPNCKAESFSALFHRVGTVETVAFSEPTQPLSHEVDLMGLDTHYIASETDRLLDNVKLAQKTLFTPGGLFYSRGSKNSGDGGARQLCAQISSRLVQIIQDLAQEARYDAGQLMQELMRIDEVLKALWLGQVLSLYDEEEFEGDDYYYDYEDDDYDEDMPASDLLPSFQAPPDNAVFTYTPDPDTITGEYLQLLQSDLAATSSPTNGDYHDAATPRLLPILALDTVAQSSDFSVPADWNT